MNTHDFEKKLQRQPLRAVPGEWRVEILRSARSASNPPRSTLNSPPAPWWRELFWPCPQAWAGLAAVWLVILTANIATWDGSPTPATRYAATPSTQFRQLLNQQQQLLAELTGSTEKPEAVRPKSAATPPRSQRREESTNA